MAKFSWFHSLGPLGTFIANAIVFLTTNWWLVVSAAIGLTAGLWEGAVSFFSLPAVQVGIGLWLASLWTIVALLILVDRRIPRMVKIQPDYRYGLTFEGIVPNIDVLNETGWLSFALQIRNYSQAPIRYTVEGFDFRIGTRALPKPKKILTGYLPRGSGKTISPSQFSKDEVREFFGKRMQGTAEISVIYGHPEEKPIRRLRIGCDITIHLPKDDEEAQAGVQPIKLKPFGFGADIITETDEAIDQNLVRSYPAPNLQNVYEPDP